MTTSICTILRSLALRNNSRPEIHFLSSGATRSPELLKFRPNDAGRTIVVGKEIRDEAKDASMSIVSKPMGEMERRKIEV